MKDITNIVRSEKGFTLIEMMIVILIISILLLIAVPSMSKSNKIVQDKSCEATIDLVQSQVAAYQMNEGALPAEIQDMVDKEYIDQMKCPGGEVLEITVDGKVQVP